MSDWFYSDPQFQQQGPLSAQALVALCREGRVDGQTLVWREGLPGWLPLAQVAAELGLVVVAAGPVPASPAAATAGRIPGIAARAPGAGGGSGSSRTAVWVIVGAAIFVFGIAVLGILAAIAIPAYHDYRMRAQVAQAVVAGQALRPAVEAWSQANGTCPRNGDGDIGAAESYAGPAVASIEVGPIDDVDGECGILVWLADQPSGLKDKYLQWALDTDGQWHVSSDLARRHLPAALRDALE